MKQKIKIAFAIILLIISFIVLILSILCLFAYNDNYEENINIQKATKKSIKSTDEGYEIDYKELKKTNNNAIAYLKVKNTQIDYAVVKGEDNEYYLTHDFNNEVKSSGWIFADYRNKLDGTDKNIIIYGHNMKDGSMFGTLKKTLDEEWQKNSENRIITLDINNSEYKYEVFSTYVTDYETYYLNTDFSDGSYNEFLNTIKQRSNYNYNVEITEEDKILTLSSCTSLNNKRVVLHAKLIN